MTKTLQLYVGRELFKTFALAAIGLTLTFSLCGGVLNMVRAEVVTAMEVVRLLGFVLPLATTLTLPVAALFACAIVYGRLAADNEFDACKASGVNILHLLAPAVALSILTAAFTFTFSNYVLPRFVERIELMIRTDIQKIAVQALRNQGYIRYGPYVLYAGKSDLVTGQDGSDVLHIQDAAFLMLEHDSLVACGTAREVRVDFWSEPQAGEPMLEAVMFDVRAMDLQRREYFQESRRPFGSIQIPKEIEQKPKWLTLAQLAHYHEHPTKLLEIRDRVAGIRLQLRHNLFYRDVHEQLTGAGKVLWLEDDHIRYEIRAGQAWLSPEDFVPELREVTVTQSWTDDEGRPRQRRYRADGGVIRVEEGYGTARDVVRLVLRGNASFTDTLDPSKRVEHRKIELDAVALPPHIARQEQGVSDEELVGLALIEEGGIRDRAELEARLPRLRDLDLGEGFRRNRIRTLVDVVDLKHEIVGIVHSRLAFSASALVTLVLAAALGIIFRGGQMLTAFVISFIPGLLVVVMNIMGRQNIERPDIYHHVLGIVVIWAGIALLAAVDAVVLTRCLKR